MENVMTNGFCELNENEMMMVDGGGWLESTWNAAKELGKGAVALSGVVVTGVAAMAAAPVALSVGTGVFVVYGVCAIAYCGKQAFDVGYSTGTNIRNCY